MAWLIVASIAASFAGSNGVAMFCAGGAVRHALNHTRKKKERQNEPVANRREYFIMDPTLEPPPRRRQLHSCPQRPSGRPWPLSRGWGRPEVCPTGYALASPCPPRRANESIVALFTAVYLPRSEERRGGEE